VIFDTILKLLNRQRRPVGLRIELGMVNSVLRRRGHWISGHGPHMKAYDGGYGWKAAKKGAVLWPAREPNPHILVSGMSGFGKSMFFKSVLLDVAKAGISCMVFDGHREHEAAVLGLGGTIHDSRNGGINILALDGATVADRTAELTGLLGNVYKLGHIQSTKLAQCLRYTYRKFGARGGGDSVLDREPGIGDLLHEIDIFIGNARTASEKATLVHLRDKVSNLNIPAFSRSAATPSEIKKGVHSFSVSERMGREARVIYMVELLERAYATMKDDPKDGRIKQYIMIDESQVLINESEECSGILTKFIEEGRKYGRGVLIVTHMSSRLNRQVVANAATFMAFYSREPSEAAYVARIMSSNRDEEQAIRSKVAALGDGEALVISANDRRPKVVSTLGMRMKVVPYLGTGDVPVAAELPERPMKLDRFCDDEGICREEARRLGGKEGLFAVDGEEWVMRPRGNLTIEHEVMVTKIHEVLKASGIGSFIHDRANGPDVVAYGNAGRVAVEYETGLKEILESVAMLQSRKADYAKVLAVIRDSELERYRRTLEGSGIALLGSSQLSGLPALI
jgi:hypothetical protein